MAATLLNEILLQNYQEPGSTTLGLDSGESSASRATFDDVDDYSSYSNSPPSKRDGTPLAGYAGWTRNVTVQWINPVTLAPSAVETGMKQITATATFAGQTIATTVGCRTNAP